MDLKDKLLNCSSTLPGEVPHSRLSLRALHLLIRWLVDFLLALLLLLRLLCSRLEIRSRLLLNPVLRCGLPVVEFFQDLFPRTSESRGPGLLASGPVLFNKVVYRPQTGLHPLTSRLVFTLCCIALVWTWPLSSSPVGHTGELSEEIFPVPLRSARGPQPDRG